MADEDDIASTLKTGFVVIGLLLAGILLVLLNQKSGDSEDPARDQSQRRDPGVGQSWPKALETRCRNLKSRLDAMDDEFAQLEREYSQGRYTEAEGSALQGRLVDKETRLGNQLYDMCAPNSELWDHLRSTW